MRTSALILAAVLCLLYISPVAADDTLALLQAGTFTTISSATLQLPHGRVLVHHALAANLGSPSKATLLTGGMDVVLDGLPTGAGVLNLAVEMQRSQASPDAGGVVQWHADTIYLSAAPTSCVQWPREQAESGTRTWHQLSPSEQDSLTTIYHQAYGDSWVDEEADHFQLRDPQGSEVYLAFWTTTAGVAQPTRYDYRVGTDGTAVSVEDYSRGVTLVQAPWAPEEGELDKNVTFRAVAYSYELLPSGTSSPRRITARVQVDFDLAQPASTIQFLSAPWFGLPQVSGNADEGQAHYSVVRGGHGLSHWLLSVSGPFTAGPGSLALDFPEMDIPVDFRGPGSGGVYRVDTSPLIPGERTTAVTIDVVADASLNSFSSTPLATGTHTSAGAERWRLSNPQANRNEMIVLTAFPSRAVPTSWGMLNITAPPDMIESTQALAGVQSLEAMVDYFLRAWGDPRNGEPVPSGVPAEPYTLNVFFIPEESGVQAFEDAGMVFILGGQQSYGGQGGGQLPLIAHEVAHVWWGNGVAAPRWFTEGMANYAAAKFVEHYYGAAGPAAGQGDPLSYRRYLINFGLGSSLPVSLARRDQLDDSAAIYHESAGFLLTADNRLQAGLDPVLARLYAQHVNGSELSHPGLRAALAALEAGIDPLWAGMVEQGVLDSGPDDPTFRELVRTPARENYIAMLSWLNPAYRKNALGDYAGAYYAMSRALEFRSEPKDRLLAAELALKAGQRAAARRHADSLAGAELDEGQRTRLLAVEAALAGQG